jgi:excisionase family DNA binding protein
MCSPVLETSHGGVSAAITKLSAVLSDDRLVVSVAEAGRLLGVSRAFAYELAARGELPTIRLGRRIVVPNVALLAIAGLSFPQSWGHESKSLGMVRGIGLHRLTYPA